MKKKVKYFCACNKKPCDGICSKLHLHKPKNSGLPNDLCPVVYKKEIYYG